MGTSAEVPGTLRSLRPAARWQALRPPRTFRGTWEVHELTTWGRSQVASPPVTRLSIRRPLDHVRPSVGYRGAATELLFLVVTSRQNNFNAS